ncbi:MAG: SDR family oxidoreductase [Candidatus Nanopelagicales bacterium]|jgi:short-subunit dehydrogenase|nr:SDR family oxidoreductase [Candidatus Nanopelagicales bacterium]MCU0294704.1 SDR family oxidoreductase [Candidatus Nanopelagicales bacterium]MCU0297177.1 SDR family oxidoreductase [Candidatus Nanopelagicales bacterium]
MPTALVTGASSGIGAAFARRLADEGYGLVLVARDEQRLASLATTLRDDHGIDVEVLPADLAKAADCRRVERRAADVDLLVNNAGIGVYGGDFAEHDVRDEDRLLAVNIRAVMRLTHAATRAMVRRGEGEIINVSSIASFAPDPVSPTYAASKAWVTSFTQGLREQLAGTGVRVMALAPGLVPTEFQQRAGVTPQVPDALWLEVDAVVEQALSDLRSGHGVSIPGPHYQAVSLAMRMLPRSVYLPLANRLQRRLI